MSVELRDGPNSVSYDNSLGPLVLYALCTTVVPERPTAPQPIVNQVYIGSDALALGRMGERLKQSFSFNKAGELKFRVVQCETGVA